MAAAIDLGIIGAGPAGLSAALTAAELGLEVHLFDDGPSPGGRIFKALEAAPADRRWYPGDDHARGADLLNRFRASDVRYHPETTVWSVSRERELGLAAGGRAWLLPARAVILAGGAMERPWPFPGWTLPGVMTAGAAQVLLKTDGMVADGPALFAGAGPLLYLIAAQYLAAGATIAALLDLAPAGNARAALGRLPGALRAPHYLRQGLALRRRLRRAGVPLIRRVTDLEARGGGQVETVSYRAAGRRTEVAARHLFVHMGLLPNSNLAASLDLPHDWDQGRLCWRPRLDGWGASELPWLAIAGDGYDIAGAVAAERRGELAGLWAAEGLGRIDVAERDRRAAPIHRRLNRELAVRPFLDRLFRPPLEDLAKLDDAITVCRCEMVSAGDLRGALALGCGEVNQLKALTRAGMGRCQGRQCAGTVAQLIAAETGRPVADVGGYRMRGPIKPIPLASLAALETGDD
ncbi:MAG: NAD(P)/FAD-dependent oxidoreductase [Alphaproteobacteria bacterium]|nr:NAD(P)/FAD-dependent oxidoreductase [Alphaproteobacteria bacterium]MDP6815052.1 NAD(P)/FAD-dependent oxidoreductase [Alphaproteobacteria bacterium]